MTRLWFGAEPERRKEGGSMQPVRVLVLVLCACAAVDSSSSNSDDLPLSAIDRAYGRSDEQIPPIQKHAAEHAARVHGIHSGLFQHNTASPVETLRLKQERSAYTKVIFLCAVDDARRLNSRRPLPFVSR